MRGVVAVRSCSRAPGRRALPRRRARLALSTALAALACTLFLPSSSAFGSTGHKLEAQLTEAPTGTPLGTPEGLAIDQNGDVFVTDSTRGLIDDYGPSGELKTQFGAGVLAPGNPLPAIALDEVGGDLYVVEQNGGGGESALHVFKPNGAGGYEFVSTWEGAHLPEEFEGFSEISGVAVDTSGKVYVADTGNETVDVFQSSEGREGAFLGFVSSTKNSA
jgi:DNA-binding beta-propeller fold protein YncE